ncbi:MAG: hypothetical protein WCC49_09585, partial [Pantoea agglomerans]
QRHAELAGDLQQRRPGLLLDRQPVVHDLGVEVLPPEDVLEVRGGLPGNLPAVTGAREKSVIGAIFPANSLYRR